MDLKSIACVLIASSALQLLRVTDAQSQFSVPSECADDTICFQNRQKHLNYPQEEIDEILQNNPVFSNSYDDYDEDEEELELLNNDSNDEVNCKTYVTLEPPFFVKGDKWYPVVQSRYLTQNIRNVRCSHEGSQCFQNLLLQDNIYNATCETQKGKIDIYAYDHTSKEIKLIPIEVNINCKCTVRDVPKE
ncbi:uncharacterized protein LOC128671516 isoform X1 [Plodia interpunctella]|uniref:uncharacterized protein LOC128671516 isoform X1 n=1 Tax=Plodia interpunctella TaxID=58824 RepID=UPI002367D34A|nr:uncharacterized protein LOC128671516 isoform X1 [Plodia interpunctella]